MVKTVFQVSGNWECVGTFGHLRGWAGSVRMWSSTLSEGWTAVLDTRGSCISKLLVLRTGSLVRDRSAKDSHLPILLVTVEQYIQGEVHHLSFSFYLFIYWLIYFVVLGLELRASTLSHSASPFHNRYFWDRVLQTICPGWLWTMILLISASWVARITGMSHQRLVLCFNFCWSTDALQDLEPHPNLLGPGSLELVSSLSILLKPSKHATHSISADRIRSNLDSRTGRRSWL
jgi:hypothetical protein